MKKLILCVFLSMLCASCIQDNTPTITVSMGLAEHEWVVMRNRVFPLFEKQYGVRINAYQMESADLVKKLRIMVRADAVTIDVISQDNMQLSALVAENLVEPLNEFEWEHDEAIPDSLYRVGLFGQMYYFVPYRPNVQIMYYDRAIFETHAIAVPQTWDDLYEAGKLLYDKTGSPRIGFKFHGGAPTATQLYEWIVAAGGDPLVFNDDGCRKTFAFLKKLFPYISRDARRAKWDTTNTYLANASFAIAQNWPVSTHILRDEYAKESISLYGGVSGPARRAHVIGGEVLAVPVGAPSPLYARYFIDFMQSREVQYILANELGWPSIRTDVRPAPTAVDPDHWHAVQENIQYGIYRPNVLYWDVFEKACTEAVERILFQDEPIDRVLDEYHTLLSEAKDSV